MEDFNIVDLYWSRDESAIHETASKYGRYCYTIAYNILRNQDDADESVNDTYMIAWDRIPPHRPKILSTFLGKITRRVSLNKLRNASAVKRGSGVIPLFLDELSECIPSDYDLEREIEMKDLTRAINSFLASIPDRERDIFVCRYWLFAENKRIAERFSMSEANVKSTLYRTRLKLKKYLKMEDLI